jgi:hypothetical protein
MGVILGRNLDPRVASPPTHLTLDWAHRQEVQVTSLVGGGLGAPIQADRTAVAPNCTLFALNE